jgi:hypothetical protein
MQFNLIVLYALGFLACYESYHLLKIRSINIKRCQTSVCRLAPNDIDPANDVVLSPKTTAVSGYKNFMKVLLSLGLGNFLINNFSIKPVQAKVSSEEDFIDALTTMILADKVIDPTNKYVDVQAYDSARSNIKYILNQLQLQKKVTELVQNSIDFSDDMDAIEAAQEAGNRITNTAMQYDSSVYTCVFIPSDDGTIPPSAEKYRKEAINYYKSFKNDISLLIKVANEEQLAKAQAKADELAKKLPPVLFKSENLKASAI